MMLADQLNTFLWHFKICYFIDPCGGNTTPYTPLFFSSTEDFPGKNKSSRLFKWNRGYWVYLESFVDDRLGEWRRRKADKTKPPLANIKTGIEILWSTSPTLTTCTYLWHTKRVFSNFKKSTKKLDHIWALPA